MKINSIALKNFKRFTDLSIVDIPQTAKLVVIAGPNGCGKSSLFDALYHWYRFAAGFQYGMDLAYYMKSESQRFDPHENVIVKLHPPATPRAGSFYLRTAHRNDPDFSVNEISKASNPSETVRIGRMIDNDQAIGENYRRLIYDTVTGVFDEKNDEKKVRELRYELIGAIRESMSRVFGDLVLNNIADPLKDGNFFFRKGNTASYHFKNLSAGEKSAFDLLLDIHIKKQFFPDAIYCIDELEVHLHTRVQGLLIREIVSVLPESSQLWITTHSLGVLRETQAMGLSNPGSVCVIDFDGLDLDTPRELSPTSIGKVTWEKFLSITLDDLSKMIAPKTVVICEGSFGGKQRRNFDADIYNQILGTHHPQIVFISGGCSTQVPETATAVNNALKHILSQSTFRSLIDRDDKSEQEVQTAESKGELVLPLRNLESYLLSEEVIEALLIRERKPEHLNEVRKIRDQAIAKSVANGNPSDDLKPAAGEIYVELKRLLRLQRCGNNSDAFLRDTLAPLIIPGMDTYKQLKEAIIDRLN